MERLRLALLATIFIIVAVLVWKWMSAVEPSPEIADVPLPTQTASNDTNRQPTSPAPPAPEDPAVPTEFISPPTESDTAETPPRPMPQPNLQQLASRQPTTRAPRNASVTGTVTVQGQAAGRVFVTAERLTDDGDWRRIDVELLGQAAYAFDTPPGDVRVTFDLPDAADRPTHLETLSVAAGRAYRLDYDFGALGSIHGTVTGVREGEFAGLLVFLGEYTIEASTPEDIDALAEEADGEKVFRNDGTYVINALEPGRYTVVALTRLTDPQRVLEEDYEFRYITGIVDVEPGQEAEFNVSLE